jgi:hypothetical protein
VLFFERLQLIEEPVVRRVRDLRVVQDVIAVEVVVHLFAELVEPCLDVLQRRCRH